MATLAPVIPTKAGLPKRRFSLNDKLALLDPRSNRKETLSRVADFRRLFAFRFMDGIVTKRGQGPSAWTAYRHPLNDVAIISHLLADRVPGRHPIWYGSRSLDTSMYLCLDVDADRRPEQILEEEYSVEIMDEDDKEMVLSRIRKRKPRPPYADRCSMVERAFRRMGINPDNPRSVLIQQTPSGGRHYYVFFDALYALAQYHDLLHAAGLRHVPGQIEFYPSIKQGLRLPFGFIPGQVHDPNAWIQFIDDFRNGRIIRHSLADLYSNLAKHQSTQARRIESLQKAAGVAPERQKPFTMGVPKYLKTSAPSPAPTQPKRVQRFLQLLDGIHSFADAQELLDLGILMDGTRTKVLNHLCAHLIWFKGLTAENAAQFLTDWAMSPRHVSKDIAADLANGTPVVAKHIRTMSRWYEDKKRTTPRCRRTSI